MPGLYLKLKYRVRFVNLQVKVAAERKRASCVCTNRKLRNSCASSCSGFAYAAAVLAVSVCARHCCCVDHYTQTSSRISHYALHQIDHRMKSTTEFGLNPEYTRMHSICLSRHERSHMCAH